MYRNLIIIVLFISAGSIIVNAQSTCDGKQIFTAAACSGDAVSPDEKALFDLVANYRASKNLPAAKISLSLSKLANRHLIDIKVNLKAFTHSWSNCPYDIKDEKTWPCIIDAPKRMNSGYNGQGYETIYVTTELKANVNLVIEAWKKSTLHNSIMTNQGMFKDMAWDEIGVAIDGNYAALWFGTPKKAGGMGSNGAGIGVTYEQVVSGLTGLLAIKQQSSTAESISWQGISPDKKIRMDISGTTKDISEAKMSVTARVETDGTLSAQSINVFSTLLRNTFPDWAGRDVWLQKVVKIVASDHTASRTSVIGKNFIEISYGAGDTIQLLIIPQSAKRAIQF